MPVCSSFGCVECTTDQHCPSQSCDFFSNTCL
jgi:hypothetical protein